MQIIFSTNVFVSLKKKKGEKEIKVIDIQKCCDLRKYYCPFLSQRDERRERISERIVSLAITANLAI